MIITEQLWDMGQSVWVMHGNKAAQAIVHECHIRIIRGPAPIPIPSIRIDYTIHVDGVSTRVSRTQLFETKEALLASL